ncbi:MULTISPECIES: Crp/Fnr family transcriptional regulator [Streptomyces]|uniref:Crp/Fnr family transcriptional regulator n=1 Tax=Streptomyces sudanensis TaxID=436397 RepID=A0ABY4TI52_9ACTN|nr:MULTISPECIES: Crp/Fnr family transcriptional regulator [Streptomyces]URN18561.1 Crp/Fnr family transcriptional regulator [Streptomyces sudanensis]
MYQRHVTMIGKSLWSQLRDLAPRRVRPARSVLLRQGDPGTHVILLDSGSTLVTLTGGNGERTLLAVRGAGELLGELAVLDAQPRTASVIAAETCCVHIIPASDFLAFVDEHALLAPLLRHAIARVREAEAVRLEMATSPVAVRLASALGRLLQAASGEGCDYVVRLTQIELSQMIGASRNAVGTALKPWREQGWLVNEAGGGLIIRDMLSIRSHADAQR